LLLVARFMSGAVVDGLAAALIATAVIGLVNTLIRPLLILLTLPLTLLTLGLFILVITGLLFYLVGTTLQGFQVQSLSAGITGALLYSLVSWLLTALIPVRST